jgi:UDP-N-acetylglucosamine 4-epimerase
MKIKKPIYKEFRTGDVLHSLADIGKAQQLLGYHPKYRIEEGIDRLLNWFLIPLKNESARSSKT